MSGIYGFTYRTSDDARCTDALSGLEYWNRVYGADASGMKILGSSGIGCHIEHFSEKFPASNPVLEYDGCPAVVDALLYNRNELVDMLHLAPDCRISDEELLLELIRIRGWDSLRDVNGDFAGAVFDSEKREWTLFRDHMGVRPLFYYMDNDLMAFSTDLRGLASLPNTDLSLNELQFYTSIRGSNPLTLTGTEFLRINCVSPASVMR